MFFWGAKARFHDLDKVIEIINPKTVELHLTDEDVEKGNLNGAIYPIDYSIHVPEYWHGIMIDPCNLDNLQHNLFVYQACIRKGLELRPSFIPYGKMKVIMHPGGMTVDPLTSEIYPVKLYKESLYRRLKSFITYLEMIPEFKDRIEILVEIMPPLPWFYGGQYYSNIFCNPVDIAIFCLNHNHKMCLDISHLGLYCNYVDIDLIYSIQTLKPYIRQIHIADAQGTDGEGANIGDGNIDFQAVMQEIKDIDCYVIPEQMWGHKNNYKEFTRTIEECNRWLI